MKLLFTRSVLLLVSAFQFQVSFSQSDTATYYLDQQGALCVKEKAVFVANGITKDNKFLLSYFVLQTGKLFRLISYSDFTMAVKDGIYTEYDLDGTTELTHGSYANNKEDGQWVYWDLEHLTDSVLYDKGNELLHITFTYNKKDKINSRQSIDSRSKTTEITAFDENGNLERNTKWINGTGDQIYYYPTGQVKAIEKYKNSRMASIKYFKPDGTEVTEKQLSRYEEEQKAGRSRPMVSAAGAPEYPGGSAGFSSFFQKNFKRPPSMDREGFSELVTVTFDLDKSGFASNIKVTGTSNRDVEIEVMTVFRRMPAWNMHGHLSFGPITYTIGL